MSTESQNYSFLELFENELNDCSTSPEPVNKFFVVSGQQWDNVLQRSAAHVKSDDTTGRDLGTQNNRDYPNRKLDSHAASLTIIHPASGCDKPPPEPSLRYDFPIRDDALWKFRRTPKKAVFSYQPQVVHKEPKPAAKETTLDPVTKVKDLKAKDAGKPVKNKDKKAKDEKKDKKGKKDQKVAPAVGDDNSGDAGNKAKENQPNWYPSRQVDVIYENERAWLVEKKRPFKWFHPPDFQARDPNIPPNSEEQTAGTGANEGIINADLHADDIRLVIKDPKTLRDYLFSRRKSNVLEALDLLFLFSELDDQSRLRVIAIRDIVERLVLLLKCTDLEVRNSAIRLAASLSRSRIFVTMYVGDGGFEQLKLVYGSPKELVTDTWLHALICNCSTKKSVQNSLFKQGYLELLLEKLINTANAPDIQKYILQTFLISIRDPTVRRGLVIREAIGATMILLTTPYPYIKYLLLELLYKLIRTPKSQALFRFGRVNGLQVVSSLLTDIRERKFHKRMMDILRYVLQAPALAKQANELGLHRRLMDASMSPSFATAYDVKEFTLESIAQAAAAWDERQYMHATNFEEKIMTLMKTNCWRVQRAAFEAVSVLCRDSFTRKTFQDLGMHLLTFFILQTSAKDVLSSGFKALAFLMYRRPEAQQQLVQKRFPELLIEKLADTDLEVKRWAILCALLLAKNEDASKLLRPYLSSNIPQWLVTRNKAIRHHAAAALCVYVADEKSRTAFTEAHGHKAIRLCSLIDSKDVEQQRNLCMAVAVLSVDASQAWLMALQDCLTPIFVLKNDSERLSQAHAAVALQRVTSTCPQLRYTFARKLDENIVGLHGFYDQGTPSLVNQPRPLEYFLRLKETWDQATDVIFVSLPRKFRNPCFPDNASSQKDIDSGVLGWAHLNTTMLPEQKQLPTGATLEATLPDDPLLEDLVDKASQILEKVEDLNRKAELIASLVVQHMGGSLDKDTSISSYNEQVRLELSMLKQRQSCIPIGSIRRGNGFHQALLFKVLASCFGLPTRFASETHSDGRIQIKGNKGDWEVLDLML